MLDGIAVFSVPLIIAEFLKTPLERGKVSELVGWVVFAIVASISLQFWIRKSGEALAGEVANHLRLKIFSSLEALDLQTILARHSGYLLSLTTQVAEGIGGLASMIVWLLGHAGVGIALFLVCTASQSKPIAGVNAVFFALFLWISNRFARKISELSAKENHARALLVERFADYMANIQTVKRLGIQEFAMAELEQVASAHNKTIAILQSFHARRWAILHGLLYTAFVLTLLALLRGVANAWVVSAMMVLFVATFAQVRTYIERVSELMKRCFELRAFVSACSAEIPLVSKPCERHPEMPWTGMEMRNVVFRYASAAPPITIPFFSLNPGEFVLVSGESGQGKSTLLALLAGLLVPEEGRQVLNGQDFRELPGGFPVSLISLVSQETDLFDRSIRENLSLGRNIPEDEIRGLLEELALGDWLSALPEGLNTRVGEKGTRVSSGQKQRLAIARALLMDRPVLFLDEPTSHLDAETERQVVSCISSRRRGRAVVVISHRAVFEDLASRRMSFRDRTLT